MNKYKNIKKILNKICSFKLEIFDDFVGDQFKINDEKKIKKILISIDCTEKIIKKAIEEKFDLIITYHPFFYPNKEMALLSESKLKQYNILKKNNIPVFSVHTSYEEKILKHLLLNKFKIKNKYDFKGELCIKGELQEPKTFFKFLNEIKKQFNIKSCDYFGNENKIIKTIMISSGSGGFNLKKCIKNKIDLFITGELKWNHWLRVKENNQFVVTVGHQMEEEFANHLSKFLNIKFKEMKWNIFIEKYFFGPIKKNSND